MIKERGQKSFPRFSLRFIRIGSHAEPSLDKRSDKPRPNRSLMVASVTLCYAALVARQYAGSFGPNDLSPIGVKG